VAIERLRYHIAEEKVEPGQTRRAISFRGDSGTVDVPPERFTSDESAARFFLDHLLMSDGQRPPTAHRRPLQRWWQGQP
jgi:hypothetical protein